MKSNNIENRIKQSLNTREIQPSSQAWDRLDAMLSLEEKPKKKSKFLYFYVAASIVALAVVLIFANAKSNSTNIITPESNPIVLESSSQTLQTDSASNQELDAQNIEVTTREKSPKPISKKSIQNQTVANNTSKDAAIQSDLTLEKTTASKLNPEQIKRANLLLASLENETSQEKTTSIISNQEPQIAINAIQLLNNVEEEMNQSYREKMVKKVSKNLSSIRDTWVNRNLE